MLIFSVSPRNNCPQDPTALRGGIGEKSLRQILAQADRVADRSLPNDRDAIRKLSGDISSMTDALCELRQDGKGATPQVSRLLQCYLDFTIHCAFHCYNTKWRH